MALADPDLRHGAPAALLLHLGAPRRLEVDAHLVDLHALLDQQPLGGLAEWARRGAVHQHLQFISPPAAQPAATRRCRPRDSPRACSRASSAPRALSPSAR